MKSHVCSLLSRNHPNRRKVNVYCCRPLLTERHSDCHVQGLAAQHFHCTNTVQTVLKVITQKLLLHVQLHNSTEHLLYKYCTNSTVCSWTVLTVIKMNLLLHVQLHNNTAHILYNYCTNYTVCNWTVLTVITQKPPLHVQLHNSTAHLLYKYCTNCSLCNWTVLRVITQRCCNMFSCTTPQQIYCKNTEQTVQSATELILQ